MHSFRKLYVEVMARIDTFYHTGNTIGNVAQMLFIEDYQLSDHCFLNLIYPSSKMKSFIAI